MTTTTTKKQRNDKSIQWNIIRLSKPPYLVQYSSLKKIGLPILRILIMNNEHFHCDIPIINSGSKVDGYRFPFDEWEKREINAYNRWSLVWYSSFFIEIHGIHHYYYHFIIIRFVWTNRIPFHRQLFYKYHNNGVKRSENVCFNK